MEFAKLFARDGFDLVLVGDRRRGRIVNLGSVGSFTPAPMTGAYAATKAYVLSPSLALSEEPRGTGVTVTALCPGPTPRGSRGGSQHRITG